MSFKSIKNVLKSSFRWCPYRMWYFNGNFSKKNILIVDKKNFKPQKTPLYLFLLLMAQRILQKTSSFITEMCKKKEIIAFNQEYWRQQAIDNKILSKNVRFSHINLHIQAILWATEFLKIKIKIHPSFQSTWITRKSAFTEKIWPKFNWKMQCSTIFFLGTMESTSKIL